MALSDVLPNSFFYLLVRYRRRLAITEQNPANILRRVPAGPPNKDPAIIFCPFDYRSGTDAELLSNIQRD
jgi:hypothetical protein